MVKPAAAVFILLCIGFCSSTAAINTTVNQRVNVDLFVMSKCPDAVFMADLLGPVLKELRGILAISMHFVPGEKQTDGTYACKHGRSECAGNIQMLCLQQATRVWQRYNWLFRFVACTNNLGMYYIGDLETAQTCLQEAAVPPGPANRTLACINSTYRDALLQQDMRNTAALGIQKSRTIQVEGKTICLRDGAEWKGCPSDTSPEGFQALFCDAFAAKNQGRRPAFCQPPRKTQLSEP